MNHASWFPPAAGGNSRNLSSAFIFVPAERVSEAVFGEDERMWTERTPWQMRMTWAKSELARQPRDGRTIVRVSHQLNITVWSAYLEGRLREKR